MTEKPTKPKYDLAAIEAMLPGDRSMAEQLALARSKRRPMTREESRRIVRIREDLRAARRALSAAKDEGLDEPDYVFQVAEPEKKEEES